MLKESQRNNRFGLVRKRLGLTLRDMEAVGIAETVWKRWEYHAVIPRRASLLPLLGALVAAGAPDPDRVLDGLVGELGEREFRRALGAVVVMDGTASDADPLEVLDRLAGVRGRILASVCAGAVQQGVGHLTVSQ
ncbi:MAG: hypothetical protein AMXMBFR33_56150 [Candidatus Xenobia bacterium]